MIDLGIVCGYVTLRYLKNIRLSNLWMILFLLNPWTYFWIFYYYTHTVSFGIMMLLFLLFVFAWKERDNYREIIYGILLGIVIYAGMKIRITNLILCMAVLITVFFLLEERKSKDKAVQLDFCSPLWNDFISGRISI